MKLIHGRGRDEDGEAPSLAPVDEEDVEEVWREREGRVRRGDGGAEGAEKDEDHEVECDGGGDDDENEDEEKEEEEGGAV
jgi:hypothetical protein